MKSFMSLLEPIMPTHITNSNKMKAFHLQNLRQKRHREKQLFHVYLDIGAPKIIIPLPSNDTLVVDLGCLILTDDDESKSDVATLLINTTFDQQQFQENDDETFLTPDSSPEAIDNSLEEETTFYSINVIPKDQTDDHVQYSSFTLSIRDIQVGYSTDSSQILEKFSTYFVVQHPVNHLWPLLNISGTLQKLIIHLDSSKIQNLCCTISPWITFINSFTTKSHYLVNVWPVLDFRLDEINVILNDAVQVLCDIHIKNINLSFINNDHSKNLTFILQTLTIFDCIQRIEKDY
ncbi:unnamed protein product [Rotaria sp. Silwood1]|nr:unnamed protein product [Rotaria sp. Silwood1]CAF5055702.1 unnamed protein product [Rotaria sp. Silwood1]